MNSFSRILKPYFVAAFLLLQVCLLAQQHTSVNYQAKGNNVSMVQIYLSDEGGSKSITPEMVIDDTKIYFTLVSADKDSRGYFKEKEIKEYLTGIQLYQDDQQVFLEGDLKPLLNVDKDAGKVLLTYNKNDLLLYKPFEFRSSVATSQPLHLDDAFCSSFHQYKKMYESGEYKMNDGKYLAAYAKFFEIIKDAQDNPEIKYYSFYNNASKLYVETAIEQYMSNLKEAFKVAAERFNVNQSMRDLDNQDSIVALYAAAVLVFEPYTNMDFPKSTVYAARFKKNISEMTANSKQNREQYNLNNIQFLKTKFYTDSYRFSFFVDLVARMLCDLDTLVIRNKLDPITPANYRNWTDKKQELVELGWLEQFGAVIGMINANIQENGIVVEEAVLANLEQQIPFQRQPYFEIIKAFNHYNSNVGIFKELLSQAIVKCTDDQLVFNLEMWVLSSNIDLTHQTVRQINEGIKLIRKGDFETADNKFRILTQQASSLAPPWYYWGDVKYNNKEYFVAESLFDRAIERYPQYIRPQSFIFQTFITTSDFEGLYQATEKALALNDIWLFHYWKAAALFYQKKYQAVVLEIENGCNLINPWSVEAYFMLGDAYKELNNKQKARWAYEKANAIDPYREDNTFDEAMQALEK